ncbi:MAG TPA: hypothetical protein ENK40_03415 [Gammaproteobacteria bacterium]|nr:hypothetical protein [Gammaproteobacteria bacterium]
MTSPYSDEFLNAYIDGELAADERSQLLDEMRQNPELASRLCKLQKVKDMVQLAYYNAATETPEPRTGYLRGHGLRALAASLLLGLGLLIGNFSAQQNDHLSPLLQLAQTTERFDARPAADKQEWKLMLHVNSGDPARLRTVLNEAEQILKTSHNSPRKVQIEMLVNGEAIRMLEDKDTPFARKILAMESRYDNIRFLACQIALNRHKDEDGFDIDLLPGIKVVPSALTEAANRQREGWTYLRI